MRNNSLRRLGACLFLSGILHLLGVASPGVEAGTVVTVNFTGTGSVTGEFSYLQSHPNVAGSPGLYLFAADSATPHDVTYNGVPWPASICRMRITVGNSTFHILAQKASTNDAIEIWITKSSPFLKTLPFCHEFPIPPAKPGPGSQITWTSHTGASKTTTITGITSCRPLTVISFPSVESLPAGAATELRVVVAPTTYAPVYVCPPRRNGCLAGFFTRLTALCRH